MEIKNYINCFVLGEERTGKSSYIRWLVNRTYSNTYKETKNVISTIIKFETNNGDEFIKFWDIPSIDKMYDETEKPDYVLIISDNETNNNFYSIVKKHFQENKIDCTLLFCQSKIDVRDDYISFMVNFSVKKKLNCYTPILLLLREIRKDPFLYLKE